MLLSPAPIQSRSANEAGFFPQVWMQWFNILRNIINTKYYGSFYQRNGTTTVTVSATDTFYIIGGMTTGEVSNVTFQNSQELLIQTAGKYAVNYSVSLSDGAGTPTIEVGVLKSGTIQANTATQADLSGAGKQSTFSGSGILSLAAGDLVQLGANNKTNTNNLTVTHANLTLEWVND